MKPGTIVFELHMNEMVRWNEDYRYSVIVSANVNITTLLVKHFLFPKDNTWGAVGPIYPNEFVIYSEVLSE